MAWSVHPAVSGAVGVLVALVGWAAIPGAEQVPALEPPRDAAVEERAPIVLPADCGARQTALDAELARVEAEIDAAELQIRILEHRRVQREGQPQPWPEAPDLRTTPEVFEANLRQAMRTAGFTGELELDCDEYPCVASVTTGHEPLVPGGGSMASLQPLLDAMNELGYADLQMGFTLVGSVGTTDLATFSLHPADGSVDPQRLGFRTMHEFQATNDSYTQEGP